MTNLPQVKPEEIKWDEVEAAAKDLIRLAHDSVWKPPEMTQELLDAATVCVNRLSEALCLSSEVKNA